MAFSVEFLQYLILYQCYRFSIKIMYVLSFKIEQILKMNLNTYNFFSFLSVIINNLYKNVFRHLLNVKSK